MRRLLLIALTVSACHRDLSVDCAEEPHLCASDSGADASVETSITADSAAADSLLADSAEEAPMVDAVIEEAPTDGAADSGAADSGSPDAGSPDSMDSTVDAAICSAGTYTCTGSDLMRCSTGGVAWERVAACDTPELCTAGKATGTCATAVCGAGAKVCNGKTARICNAGRTAWIDTPCSIGCSAGSCLRVTDMPIDMGAHVCVAMSDGSVRCWGENLRGQVGDASTPDDVPGLVSGISSALQVAVSGYTSAARLSDGSLRWWGELYTASTPGYVDSAVPLSIPGLPTGTSVMVGARRVCAVQSDKTLKCYGKGPLGDGTWNDFTTAKAVPGLANVLDGGTVLELERAGFAIVDGGAKGWGTNSFGQLATGATGEQLTPVSTYSFATQISFHNSHSCARLASGGVRCVGNNDTGQLGNGTTKVSGPVLVPVDVPGIAGARNVCTGQYFSCAALADKTVRCWGLNDSGQLGDGSTTDHYSQAPVTGITTAVKVGCGYEFACALLEDGTMKCWGDNQAGQLGIGKSVATNRTTAVSPAW